MPAPAVCFSDESVSVGPALCGQPEALRFLPEKGVELIAVVGDPATNVAHTAVWKRRHKEIDKDRFSPALSDSDRKNSPEFGADDHLLEVGEDSELDAFASMRFSRRFLETTLDHVL